MLWQKGFWHFKTCSSSPQGHLAPSTTQFDRFLQASSGGNTSLCRTKLESLEKIHCSERRDKLQNHDLYVLSLLIFAEKDWKFGQLELCRIMRQRLARQAETYKWFAPFNWLLHYSRILKPTKIVKLLSVLSHVLYLKLKYMTLFCVLVAIKDVWFSVEAKNRSPFSGWKYLACLLLVESSGWGGGGLLRRGKLISGKVAKFCCCKFRGGLAKWRRTNDERCWHSMSKRNNQIAHWW